MSLSNWVKVEFNDFIKEFGLDSIILYAPTILYSKKDKEHESYNSLIIFFLLIGLLFIYISISFVLVPIYFNLVWFIIIVVLDVIFATIFMLNYLRTNIRIKPIECWIEIYRNDNDSESTFYCFCYYPIFSGRCFPNEGKNLILKLYEEEKYGNTIDITQIEIYLKMTNGKSSELEKIGYYFPYGEGRPFKDENIHKNQWIFFDGTKYSGENYLAIANWAHQYEWRFDLALDFDKLNTYAPWIIQKWNRKNLKPLTERFKAQEKFNHRFIQEIPKLSFESEKPTEKDNRCQKIKKEIDIINKAINDVLNLNENEGDLKKIKRELFQFKSYFRDLNP